MLGDIDRTFINAWEEQKLVDAVKATAASALGRR
jgi:hypothetical protein